MTKDELIKQKQVLEKERKDIEDKIAEIEKTERLERIRLNEEKLNHLRQNREFVLSLFKHSSSRCSDENHINGYSWSKGYCGCEKCFLIEILDDEYSNFEVNFGLSFSKI